MRLLIPLSAILLATAVSADAEVWPEREWATATPESAGMSAAGLDQVEAYAQNHGGVSGCVIRFGTLVKEWGPATARADIKSAAKGAIGATALGLAVDAGLVRLDDRGQKYLPEIGTETPGNSREWLGEITLRHLATMTAGFDDGRPPRLVYRPGTSPEFIAAATCPTELPAPYPYYGFYWGSNAKGILPEVPRDTFWALGRGDSILVVCPSLDLVAVRLGTGNNQSQLPPLTDEWEKKVGGFFALVARAVVDPYARSPVIRGITWAPPATIVRQAKDSDNWPLTWADDDHLYTAYGDGTGFPPKAPEKLSLGLARIEGGPEDCVGVNLRSPTGEQPKGDGKNGKKASGLLMVDGVLFMWVRNAGNAQVAWSRDHAQTWTWADWTFTTSFGCPSFLNFGRNYAGARDDYVYVYSHDSDSAYKPADRLVLARVPKDRIALRVAYEFFQGQGADGNPIWTSDLNARGAVFTNPGRCYRTQVSYDAALKRYLLCQTGTDAGVRAGFGIYDAPEPWGPWTTVMRVDKWDVDAGESCSFPTRWMSADGKTLHLVFSGDDSFAVRKATLQLTGEQNAPR